MRLRCAGSIGGIVRNIGRRGSAPCHNVDVIHSAWRAGSVVFAESVVMSRHRTISVLALVPHHSDIPYILVVNRIVRVPNSQQRSRKKFLRLCRRMVVLCRSGQPSTPGCQLTHSSCCVVAHTTIRSSHRGTVEYSLESVVVSQGKDGGAWSLVDTS